jgi:hypothetical protein
MRDYEEFRLVVTPVLHDPSRWTVRVDRSPVPAHAGMAQDVAPSMTREQLGQLQAGSGWPNIGTLQAIGDCVWSSILPTPLNFSFDAAYAAATARQHGMRVVVVRQVGGGPAADPNRVGLPEMPFEAIRRPDAKKFLALDELTPLSRGLQIEPDQPPYHLEPPVRVLVVVAKPKDKPSAAVGDEGAAIQGVVAPLGAQVSLKLSPSGTYEEFRAQLEAFRPHVVHFVGHGGYAPIGDDPTPQPHICFERSDDGKTHYVDADTLSNALESRDVRLVVLTACQSAGAAPALGPYEPQALDGIAQRLVLSTSGVSAAVAMQFDFEAAAAVAFSRELYRHLLDPGRALDEAVTLARKEVLQQMNAGHRAWVTPVVYWRCRDGRVFDIGGFDGPLDHNRAFTLQGLEATRETRIKTFVGFLPLLAANPASAPKIVADNMTELTRLDDERGQLFRQCLRLSAESAPAGGRAQLRILLRTAVAGRVDLVRLRLRLPDGLALQPSLGAAGLPHAPAIAPVPSGEWDVLVSQPSAGAPWPPGEREIGTLVTDVGSTVAFGFVDLRITEAEMTRGAAAVKLRALEPLLFAMMP